MNMFLTLDTAIKSAVDFCKQPLVTKVTYYVGLVIMVIKIAVPILLIVLGTVELLKAITAQDDSAIKKAQSSLVKKIVIGIVIFLVPSIVGMLMSIIGENEYENCISCVKGPFSDACSEIKTLPTPVGNDMTIPEEQ